MLRILKKFVSRNREPQKPITNIGLQIEIFNYDSSHFKPPQVKVVRTTKPENTQIHSEHDSEYQAWVSKTEDAPKHKISYEGTPRAIWYAVEFENEIKLGFLINDYSGFVHDDSEETRKLAELSVGDLLSLFKKEYDGQSFLWPTVFK